MSPFAGVHTTVDPKGFAVVPMVRHGTVSLLVIDSWKLSDMLAGGGAEDTHGLITHKSWEQETSSASLGKHAARSPCKLCALRRWSNRALAETYHCVSVGIHRGTGWNGHVVLRQDGHAHTEHQSKLPWCGTSGKGLLSFALLASECTQNAKDVIDTMLFKSKQGVQADLDRHTPHLLAFRSCCQDDRIHCCGLLSKSCGYQGGRGCASVERGIRCLGIA